MKRFLTVLFLMLFVIACSDDNKRPDGDGFNYKITGSSILANATVKITDEENKTLKETTTSEDGKFEASEIKETNVTVQVCNGSFYNSKTEENITFAGCLQNTITGATEDVILNVDFITTLAEGNTEEWKTYIDVDSFAKPEEDNTALTDSMKTWLWQQGLIIYSSNMGTSVSDVFEKIKADLEDDNIINGSTKETVGNDAIGANTLRINIVENMPETTFSTTTWKERLKTKEVSFLAATGENEDKITITIQNATTHTAQDVYAGSIEVVAKVNFSVSGELTCSIDSGEGTALITTDSEQYKTVIDITSLENGSHTLTCEASNGETTIEGTENFIVDSNKPDFVIKFYETGTKNETGTEDTKAENTIDMEASATHSAFVIEDLFCKIKEGESFADTDTTASKFKTKIDTTTLIEGENTITCVASINNTDYTQDVILWVQNRIIVTILGYIAYPIQNDENNPEKIKITDESGVETEFNATNSENKFIASLQKSKTYKFTLTGGKFTSLTGTELKTFSSELITRKTIDNTTTEIIITPLTTLHEYIRKNVEDFRPSYTPADEIATIWLEGHYGAGSFAYDTKPQNGKTNDVLTKSFLANGAFELLAQYIEQEKGLAEGTISVNNILVALKNDLQGDGMLNGGGIAIENFTVDSYFYRLYYGIALYNYMKKESVNVTKVDIPSLAKNAASDNSPLFPSDKEPISILEEGVEIKDIMFSTNLSVENETWTEYENVTSENYPVFQKEFKLSFNVVPKADQGQFVNNNSIAINFDSRFNVTEIKKTLNEDKSYSCEYLISVKDEFYLLNSDESIYATIEAEDLAGKLNSEEIKTAWDTTSPLIGISMPAKSEVTPNAALWSVEITETNFKNATRQYTLPNNSVIPEVNLAQSVYDISLKYTFEDNGALEGKYSIKVVATDKAGNSTVETREIILDNTPPELTNDNVIVTDTIKNLTENDWTNINKVSVTINNEDVDNMKLKITCNGVDISDVPTDYINKKTYTLEQIPEVNSNTNTCRIIVTGKDVAGNETNFSRIWKTDYHKPQSINITGIDSTIEYHNQITITVSATDELSGIKTVAFKAGNNGSWNNCIKSGSIFECKNFGTSGISEYTIEVCDTATNCEDEIITGNFNFVAPPVFTVTMTPSDTFLSDSGTITYNKDDDKLYTCTIEKMKSTTINYTSISWIYDSDLVDCSNNTDIISLIKNNGNSSSRYRVKITSAWKSNPALITTVYSNLFAYINPSSNMITFNYTYENCQKNGQYVDALPTGETLNYNNNCGLSLNIDTNNNGYIEYANLVVGSSSGSSLTQTSLQPSLGTILNGTDYHSLLNKTSLTIKDEISGSKYSGLWVRIKFKNRTVEYTQKLTDILNIVNSSESLSLIRNGETITSSSSEMKLRLKRYAYQLGGVESLYTSGWRLVLTKGTATTLTFYSSFDNWQYESSSNYTINSISPSTGNYTDIKFYLGNVRYKTNSNYTCYATTDCYIPMYESVTCSNNSCVYNGDSSETLTRILRYLPMDTKIKLYYGTTGNDLLYYNGYLQDITTNPTADNILKTSSGLKYMIQNMN